MGNFKVVIDGFKTEAEAIAWCFWYEGSGEQNAQDIGENISSVMTDMDKYQENGGFKTNENNEIILPVTIHYNH